MNNTDIDSSVLLELRRVVDDEHGVTEGAFVSEYERATFASNQSVHAVIMPSSREHVQEAVRVAKRKGLRVYPISRGRNWGLGSRLPAADNCVVMDLSRMNRILAYDEDLSYLTVQPGVTFAQAAEFLRSKNSAHYLCVIGGPPDASLIGNALERGDGAGRFGDRFLHTCALEVVLSSGECIHTGLARYPPAKAAPVHRYGVGPFLDGLFTQSNFGIVTQATFWLPRKPPHFQSLLFTLADDERMLAAAEAVKDLMALGVVQPNSLAIWNAYKFATTDHQYPWDAVGGHKPLRPEQLNSLKSPWRGAKWVAVAGLYSASGTHARADRKLLAERLKPLAMRWLVVNKTRVRLARFFRKPLKRLGLDVDSVVRVLFSEPIFLGYPTKKSIGGCYWRKRMPVPSDPDPDRDRCGVIWLCPAVPFTREDLRQATAISTEISFRYGFEPHIAITFPSDRCAYFLPSLLYDRDAVGEDEAAMRCHDEMFKAFLTAGYYPHRLGIQSMDLLPAADDDWAAVWQRLKQAFDPAGILAPGRYEFGRSLASLGGENTSKHELARINQQ